VLDTGVLGYLLQDVTQYVRSVRTRRGKSTLQGKFTAGQMTVVFDNRSRAFDPKYTSSPYNGSIVPRRRIIFSIAFTIGARTYGPYPQFTGYVDDWNLSYDLSGDSLCTAQCSDAFTILANQNITLTNPPAEYTSDRMRRVLTSSSVGWSLENCFGLNEQSIVVGTASYTGNALDYLQTISDSEAGYFFVSGDGKIGSLGWNEIVYTSFYQSPSLYFSNSPGSAAYPIHGIEVVYGTEELVNNATVSSYAGTVTAQNTTSQQDYGITSKSYPVLTSTVGQMTTLANFYITNYANPRYRLSQIKLNLDDPVIMKYQGSTGIFYALIYDIGTLVNVSWIPNGIGSAITQQSLIIGLDIDATPESCTFTYSIAGEDTRSYI